MACQVAKNYNEHDMPHGWMLPNDGYGCGYGEVVICLHFHPYVSITTPTATSTP